MKKIILVLLLPIFFLVLENNPIAEATTILPSPNPGLTGNSLKFDDAYVFSLAYLNYLAGGSPTKINPNTSYDVSSNGDAINNSIVIFSGTANDGNARLDNQDLGLSGGVDNAYESPNMNNQAPATNFLMQAPDPAVSFTGDNVLATTFTAGGQPGLPASGELSLPLWDIQVAGLRDYLTDNNSDLVFYFNLNEQNATDTLDKGQDMLGWMMVSLTNSSTDVTKSWFLSGNNTAFPLWQSKAQTGGVDDILPGSSDEWAHVHGQVCVSKNEGLVYLGSCNAAAAAGVTVPLDAKTVDQNLGDNQAAFAIYFEELNDLVLDPTSGFDIMTVDARMAHIDNGYDQMFIRLTQISDSPDIPTIPEPATILLMGFGLMGASCFLKKRMRS